MKDYKYTPPAAASDDKPDENGITLAMLDFDPDRDVQPQVGTCSNFKTFVLFLCARLWYIKNKRNM